MIRDWYLKNVFTTSTTKREYQRDTDEYGSPWGSWRSFWSPKFMKILDVSTDYKRRKNKMLTRKTLLSLKAEFWVLNTQYLTKVPQESFSLNFQHKVTQKIHWKAFNPWIAVRSQQLVVRVVEASGIIGQPDDNIQTISRQYPEWALRYLSAKLISKMRTINQADY